MSQVSLIGHQSTLTLIGSCFSDEMGTLLQHNGFKALVNPGGTLFHPMAIGNLLQWALDPQFKPLRIYQRNDVFLSWDTAGSIYALSEKALLEKFENLHQTLRAALQQSTHLLLTFGSSWAYSLRTDNQIVANCHKAPKAHFSKSLSDLNQMLQVWNSLISALRQENPELQLIFTVSPVRHLNDGLVENNRSKARLHLLVEALCKLPSCTYFEAFELVNDQLRDYVFYKEDGAHPNHKALAVVWEHFKQQLLSASAQKMLEHWEEVQKLKAHKLLYPESQEAKHFLENLKQREADFFNRYPDFQRSTPF